MPPHQVEEFNGYLALVHTAWNLVPFADLFRMEILCMMMHVAARLQHPPTPGHNVLTKDAVPTLRKLWARLLAWERLRDELVAQFGDPVIVPPTMNDILDNARELLADWHSILKPEVEHLTLPRMDEAALSGLRKLVRHQQRLYEHK